MNNENGEKKRIFLLDEIRGFCVFVMIIYHAYFVMNDFYSIGAAGWLYDFFTPLEPIFAGVFISICGLSCTLSHNNLKRGLKVLAAAAAFSLVTCVILPHFDVYGAEVYFGILHFLAVSILIFIPLKKLFYKIDPRIGVVACAVLFFFFRNIEKGSLGFSPPLTFNLPDWLYTHYYLVPFGMYPQGFTTADYFPLLPFIFIFFAGVFLGVWFQKNGYPDFAYKKRVPFFDYLGRHAFIVYLAHIPVIALIVYGVLSALKIFS